MKIKYSPVSDSDAEWDNKEAILSRYDGLNKYTLNRWLCEMRDNKLWRDGVLNPTHKLVFINFEVFDDFLYWKTHDYSKLRRK